MSTIRDAPTFWMIALFKPAHQSISIPRANAWSSAVEVSHKARNELPLAGVGPFTASAQSKNLRIDPWES
jgi:hypothetical protein